MTYSELLNKLTACKGPCLRLCSYCPEVFEVAEIKECVENLVKTMYRLQTDKDALMVHLMDIYTAYKAETGKDFKFK